MSIKEKYTHISRWFYESMNHWEDNIRPLDTNIRLDLLQEVEKLVEVKLSQDYKDIYSFFNGEYKEGVGTFRGHIFLSLDLVIEELNMSKENWKPYEELPEYDRIPSFPVNYIQTQYYHKKWIPFLSDHCGNFIGIDMEPDSLGVVGQVIVYGKDENINFVVASSLGNFLDLNIQLINTNPNILLSEKHLHDIYKEVKNIPQTA
jgi:cell wall assembly regulator SMI1